MIKRKDNLGWLIWITFLATLLMPFHSSQGQQTLITDAHINTINHLFKQQGVPKGYVTLDRFGRIELRGEFNDEKEVDRAFGIAQSIVGVKWVSFVTPENIKNKEWEKELSSFFLRAKVLKPTVVKDDQTPGPIRNKYALVVGIGEFLAESQGINKLDCAVRDATSFYQFLADPRRGAFFRENIIFLKNQSGTRQNISNAFEKIKNLAQPDDLVVIYMSSHGTPPEKFGGVFIVTYDTEVKPKERVWHTSITESMLKDFIENLRAKRLVMILDACYSNGAYRKVEGFLPKGGKSLGGSENEGYGISREYGRRLLGAKDIVLEEAPQKPKSKYKSIGDGQDDSWGKVLIGASGPGEISWESPLLNNSIFTYYFIDGLNRHKGGVETAFNYSKPLVYQRVKQEKGNDIDQNPQVIATNPNWNMYLTPQRLK